MESEIIKVKLDNLMKGSSCLELDYWKNISFSLKAIEHCVDNFLDTKDPVIAISYAKTIIMEVWNIRELLGALNIPLGHFNEEFPKLKALRDSYAHIKERLEGKMQPSRSSVKPLIWEKKTVANGILVSDDGKSWRTERSFKRVFNIKFDGGQGVMSIFGLVDDFVICNSEAELIEFEISNEIVTKLIKLLEDACD